MTPSAEPWEKHCEEDEAGELHVQHGSKSADTVGGETRQEIRAAPRESCQEAQQDSHGGL